MKVLAALILNLANFFTLTTQETGVIKSINYQLSCNKKYLEVNVTHNQNPDDFTFNATVAGQFVFTAFKVKMNYF